MRLRLILFLITLLTSFAISAQRLHATDSLFCVHLNDLIRCVSMKQIFEPVGKVRDSSDIYPFIPRVRLTRVDAEVIRKRDNKVTYTAEILSVTGSLKQTEVEQDEWYKRIHACLDLWEMTRLANRDKKIKSQDYFITNSEDETTVRLTINRDKRDSNYHVQLTIY